MYLIRLKNEISFAYSDHVIVVLQEKATQIRHLFEVPCVVGYDIT